MSSDTGHHQEQLQLSDNHAAINSSPTAKDNQCHQTCDSSTSSESSSGHDYPQEGEISLLVKWSGSTYPVELSLDSTIANLKTRLFELTEVLPKRQKVLGLPYSQARIPPDDLALKTLNLKQEQRIMLIGSREADISAVNSAYLNSTDVLNDFDVDYDPNDSSVRVLCDSVAVYRRRLERRIQSTKIQIMNPPRNSKKLLVLDLDYTLFDCRSSATTIAELGRPGLHELLASAYRFYDIVVWSQTSWRFLEAKLTELSVLFAQNYKICFVLDRTSMFSVTSRKHGQDQTHEVKALNIIWHKYSDRWNATNTIHVDDLSRNFALNPQSGLKISPFKNAPQNRDSDVELFLLERYLSMIAQNESDFTKLNHKHWKRYCSARDPSFYKSVRGTQSNSNSH